MIWFLYRLFCPSPPQHDSLKTSSPLICLLSKICPHEEEQIASGLDFGKVGGIGA